jgi:nicotinate-nucleotide pyrophosphorylase
MTLATVREYALAGPDCVSVGALTHSVRAADLALDLELEPPRG